MPLYPELRSSPDARPGDRCSEVHQDLCQPGVARQLWGPKSSISKEDSRLGAETPPICRLEQNHGNLGSVTRGVPTLTHDRRALFVWGCPADWPCHTVL